jgi:hypothetical protein
MAGTRTIRKQMGYATIMSMVFLKVAISTTKCSDLGRTTRTFTKQNGVAVILIIHPYDFVNYRIDGAPQPSHHHLTASTLC